MKSIREIFDINIQLLGYIDRAVILFREGRYDEALGMVAESVDGINSVTKAVIGDRDYFESISPEYVSSVLSAVLEAKQKKDYVLLADIYELQLSGLLGGIQELILEREDFFGFNVSDYNRNIRKLEQKLAQGMESISGDILSEDDLERLRVNRNALLEEPLSPESLLNDGYSVEFTSCGLMTLRAPMQSGGSIYLHTNGNILRESFLQADRWRENGIASYIVFGFGMGYHIAELLELEKFARVTVFESDVNVLKLYAAFADITLLDSHRLTLVYDPDRTLVEDAISRIAADEKACVHYPSMRRAESGKLLHAVTPFANIVELC